MSSQLKRLVLRHINNDFPLYSAHLLRSIRRINSDYPNLIHENIQLKNTHPNERCFILANGPSTRDLDLSILRDEFVFTMNQLPRRADFPKLHTNIHFWADWRFFVEDTGQDAVDDIISVMRAVNTGDNKPLNFFTLDGYRFVKRHHLEDELSIKWFAIAGSHGKTPRYNYEFDKVIPNFRTTVFYEILLAVYMGFTEIYLIGCDCTGFISTAEQYLKHAEKSLYSYEISETEKRRMEHVIQKGTIREELQSYVILFDEYEYVLDYCTKRNVKLINATDGGLLESIPRMNLSDLF